MRLPTRDDQMTTTTATAVHNVVLCRQSNEENYGFTLRHVVVYPPAADAEGEQDEQFVEAVQTALVSRVEIGSPAYFAGLRSGQRILAVDGVPVSDRSYIDIVKLIADSRTQLVLMIVTGFDASATSSPMLADSPGPIANGRGDLSSSLTSVSTAVAVPSVAHSVDWSQQSATSSSTPVSWNEHGDQEGRIGALLGEMRPQRARLAASSSPLSTAYSRPVWVRAQPVSSAEPPPYLRGAVSHDNFAHISSVDCSSTASSNGTNFRRGDVYRLPQPSNQLLSRTVSQESTASDTHLHHHHHHHPVVGRSISATTDNGCMKRAFSTGLGPSHRPLVKQVPPSPSALPPYSASGYQRSSVADPQSRWPMPSIYESEPALTFYTTQPASSTTRPLMAPVSRGYFVTSNHATNGGDAHHHEEDEVAANAEWASSVDANGNDSPIRIRSPHSPISHLKRFAANDWDRRLLTAADSTPTSNGNLNDSRRYTVRQASFIAAVSGQTCGVDISASSPPLFCFSGATGTTPPSTSRPSRQSVVSRLLVGADPFICMRRPSPSAHDDGRLRMSKRLRRGSLRLSTTSGANVDRRPLRTRSAHSRRPPGNGRVVTDDSEATRPSLSNDVPPAPTIAPTNGCDSSSSGDSTTSGSLRARQAKRPKSYIMATNCVAADDDDAATAVGHQRRAVADDRSDKRVASAFAAAVASSPSPQLARTNAPHPPAAHRIQKFITFFSTHEAQPSKAPGPLAIVNVQGRGGGAGNKSSQLKKHKSDGVQRARPQPIPVRAADVLKQGQLVHRQVPFANTTALPLPAANANANTAVAAADARQRLWDQCWAVLHESTLYLCRQLSSYTSEHTGDKILNIPADSLAIDVRSAICDIAYGEQQADSRQHVLRLTTQRRTEHLLQAASADDMLKWIEELQRAGRVDVDDAKIDDGATELIMERYNAKSSQITSPVAGKRTSKADKDNKCSSDALTADSQEASSSSQLLLSSAHASQSTASTSANDEGEGTPKSGRRWKKPKANKSRNEPVRGGGKGGPVATSALGNRITDCPTSGEGDLVPLLIQLCVKVVEAHGIDTVGIYRIPGNTAAVNSLRDNLTQGFENVDFSDPRWKDVNVVSSLLKMFLRKLPEPLLTDKLYPFFIDANRITGHAPRLKKLRHLARKLPRPHYATLKYLISHLRLVVAHSDVNKMETRNLSLMFGPSIVRPSDDNMATMVTHMSDQCKIIESLINYHDWIFDENCDDEPPPPLPEHERPHAADHNSMATSFTDMQDLLRLANKTDEEAAERGKDNRIKGLLNVRRNSKKDKSSRNQPTTKLSPRTAVDKKQRSQSDKPLTAVAVPSVSVEQAFTGQYQERDIDAEIANRLNKSTESSLAATPGGLSLSADNSPSPSSPGSVERLSPTETDSPWTARTTPLKRQPSPTKNELESAVAEMRKRRELNIYSARRIFISGSNAPSDGDAHVDDVQHNANLDDLVSHTRHLNLTGVSKPALDVLSPETREKIRRMQVEGQLRQLRHKEQRQTAELKQIEQARQLAERAYHRARDEADADDALDSLPDAISLKSDYSTTSSSVPPPGAMSVSCIDGLGGYAPSSASPSSVSPQITRSTLSSATPSVCASPAFARSKPWYEVGDEQEERRSLVTPLPAAQSVDQPAAKTREESPPAATTTTSTTPTGAQTKNGSRTALHASSSSPPSRTLTPGEKTSSRISQKIRFRNKHTDRRDPRRHTLSDIEQIKAAFGAENGDARKDGSASGRGVGAAGQTKVGKLARWFKNSFRKSSPDLLVTTADAPPNSNNVVRHTSSLV